MRPKILIPGVIFLMALLAALLWLRPTPNAVKLDIAHQTIQSSNMLVVITNAEDTTASTGMVSNTEPSTGQSTSENPKPSPEMIRKYMESLNVPVQFYGKIIDQDGNPLPNARVQGEVLHLKVIAPVPGGDQDEILPIDQKTDLNGRFEIQGLTGRGLVIESLQKDGFEPEPWQHSSSSANGSFENPVTFKMWNTNIHEQLITGERKFPIVPDGRHYFIDLTKGTIAESGEGDLKVWVQYTNQPVRGQFADWSCEIVVVKGGLQEGDSYSMFSAPTEGYVPSFVWKNQIKGGQRGSIGDKKFYIMLKNGKVFGRIQIDLIAPFNMGIPGMVRLSYAINPSGSRILR